MKTSTISRRSVLKGAGVLVVSFSLTGLVRPGAFAQGTLVSADGPEMPYDPKFDPDAMLEMAPDLDSWLKIDADGLVTFYTGRVEIGNGIITALSQVVAEELDVSFERVHMISGDTDVVPNQGITSASTTIGYAAPIMQKAAATARRSLLELAADDLGVDIDSLDVENGVISVRDDLAQKVSYGELIGDRAFKQVVDESVTLKTPDTYRIIGQSQARVDIPGKLTAAEGDFCENARVDGMRFARILRAPAYGARLTSYDEAVADEEGIIAVLPVKFLGDDRLARKNLLGTMPGDWIGVVAEREDQALRAVDRLRESAEWDITSELQTTSDGVYDWLVEYGAEMEPIADLEELRQQFQESKDQAEQTLAATYRGPYLSHGPISLSWALADVQDDHAIIHSATQWPFGSRWMVAQALGFEKNEQVQVLGGSSSGLYGRRDDYDQEVDVEAAILSQAVGEPVRLQYTRQEEFSWSQYRPAQVLTLEAGLDDTGQINGTRMDVWTAVRGDHPLGVLDPMLETPYNLGPLPLTGYDAGALLRTGWMRNVFRGYNVFALESFPDELAHAANEDSIDFRLKHLDDPRAVTVLEKASEQAGWKPSAQSGNTGMGVCFTLYGGPEGPASSYLAYIAEVEVDKDEGTFRVVKMTCAVDAGLVVNPDGLTNQVEGGVIQAMSWCMKEDVTFDTKIVTSNDWASYPILTFPETPEIDVVLIDRPGEPAKGVGEPVTVPVSAAIANAIYDATGARMRDLPMTPERFKAVLAEV